MSLNSAHKPHPKRVSFADKKDFGGNKKNFGRASAPRTTSNTATTKVNNIHAKWGFNPNEVYYSVSKDLPTIEDTEAAVEKIITILGPMGRMLGAGRNTKHNIKVSVGKMEKVWYGDIDFVADADAIKKLEQEFGVVSGRSLEFSL